MATPRRPILNANGYIDLGFFAAGGNGVGIVQDVGPKPYFPQYANRTAGCSWATCSSPAINSRGEVADLGESPGSNRFDSIDSRRRARLHRQRSEPAR